MKLWLFDRWFYDSATWKRNRREIGCRKNEKNKLGNKTREKKAIYGAADKAKVWLEVISLFGTKGNKSYLI